MGAPRTRAVDCNVQIVGESIFVLGGVSLPSVIQVSVVTKAPTDLGVISTVLMQSLVWTT